VSESIGVTDARDFETRFINLGPQLQMVPGKGNVLGQNFLAKVANTGSKGESGRRLWNKVRAGAHGKPDGPHLVRTEADPAAVGGMAKAHPRCIPVFRAGSQSGVFQFDGIIKLVDGAGQSNTAGVA